jgi:S-(hydroxymethyl)glutathione dehydrogenase/alcohol dehydrogenase
MKMKTKAAIVYEYNKPMIVEEVDLDPPREKEVLIQFSSAGLCHSDLSIMRGALPVYPLPCILGHEGAGKIVEVGSAVTKISPNDHALMMWVPVCGDCFYCRRGQHNLCSQKDRTRLGTTLDGSFRLKKGKENIYMMAGVGSFSEFNVVSEQSVLPLQQEIPLDVAALFGCAAITGFGAVINKARVPAGSSVAIVGCGGVGMNVIQAAAIIGATDIVAIDVNTDKLELAKKFGATLTINSLQTDVVEKVKDITSGRGVDYAFEAVGRPDTALSAFNMIRRGGYLVLVGIPNLKETLVLPMIEIPFMEKSVLGCYYGSGDIRLSLDTLIKLYNRGSLKTDLMISARYRLEEINKGFEDLESGKNLRGLIMY